MDFESMTIGQLKELTEQYERLKIENTNLRKYPKKAAENGSEEMKADKLVEGLA